MTTTTQVTDEDVRQMLESISSGSFLSDMATMAVSVGIKIVLAFMALGILYLLYWYTHKKSAFDLDEVMVGIKNDPKASALYLGCTVLGIAIMLGLIISR